MKMFMFKSLFLACIMFICVLYGMQQANDGIIHMRGYGEEQFQGALSIKDGEEVSILGSEITSHDLEKKKTELEEIKAYNLLASLGKSLAEFTSNITEQLIRLVTGLIMGEGRQ
jgi:hypothetical protein